MTITGYVREINGTLEKMGDFTAYVIDPEPIGTGGFSKIYKVVRNGHSYAMKIPLNANLNSDMTIKYDPDDRTRFMEEAEKWALASDNAPDEVVCLVDYNIEPFPWMVMELGSCSLKDMIATDEASPSDIVSLLHSLQVIHDTGMVHRDIKPENILRIDGKLKFTDFGLSKVVGSMTKSTGGLKGTPFYMAPEQVSSKKFGSVDNRTDIWQMGILLYEVLMHKLPFHSKDIAEVGMAITLDGPDYSDAPLEYRLILDKALCQDKEGRFASAEEFASALEKLLGEGSGVRAEESEGDDDSAMAMTLYEKAMESLAENTSFSTNSAIRMLTEAAKMGNLEAQVQLGYMYGTGSGVTLNGEQCIMWYTKAAEQGDVDSMYNLGVIYAQNNLVHRDVQTSKKWASKAAKEGDKEAERLLRLLNKLK